jgi:hypothetical protein
MATIPKYAQHVPQNLLVRCLCRGKCGKLMYAKASKSDWTRQGPTMDPAIFAICLRCGYRATDEYNWLHV